MLLCSFTISLVHMDFFGREAAKTGPLGRARGQDPYAIWSFLINFLSKCNFDHNKKDILRLF